MTLAAATESREYLADLARRLDAADHGDKTRIKAEAAALLGWSMATLHARLARDVGWTSGRKPRSDKGTTRVGAEALLQVAALERESLRKNGKQILFTPDAAQILEANGVELPVSNGHLNRLMRARKLSVGCQRQAKAYVGLRSDHPNHVHQVDPSLCVLYYLPNGEQHMMESDKFYKNKLDNYAKVALKVWRYVLYDHTTALIAVRYYAAAGESAATLFEFLMWAWSLHPDREFHGVPRILLWDKGSSNTSAPIIHLLDALEVQAIAHKAGAANVKGGVEKSNDIAECKFESRLKFEPVRNVDELNAAVLAWQNAFNADLIPRQDNRLKRNGMTPTARLDLWRRITADQLRLCPPVDACRALLAGAEVTRTVGAKLTIAYKHPRSDRSRTYAVDGLDGICRGDTVTLQPLLFGDCAIRIHVPRYDGAPLSYRLEAEPLADAHGFMPGDRTIGAEYRSVADTAAAQSGKAMDALAYPGLDAAGIDKARARQQAPFGGALDAHSHLREIAHPTALPRRGTTVSVPDIAQVEARPLNHAQIAAWAVHHVDGWDGDKYRQMVAWFPDGVLEQDLGRVADRFRAGLRLVAGL